MKTRKWNNGTQQRAYYSWRNMRRRCTNPSDDAYPNYGGRGITVCERWESYDAFFEDMGNPAPGLSLDRIDNSKGYSPENCRWATVREQLNNQRRNVVIEHSGIKMTIGRWATHLGLQYDTLYKRLERMGPDKALAVGYLREWRHGTRAGYEGHGCRCDLCKESNNARHRAQRKKRRNT
jgi:hypothetical protein